MNVSVFNKISTVVLWVCMLITLVLSVRFFYVSFTQSVNSESTEISVLLSWIFSLLFLTFCCGMVFSFIHFIRQWKENPTKARRSITVIFIWSLLLFITWLSGSGNPLPLIGYKGNENTFLWLKLTDMWLYSIYILLALGFFALFGGIIWSYFKKGD